jgi:hypothetical protein
MACRNSSDLWISDDSPVRLECRSGSCNNHMRNYVFKVGVAEKQSRSGMLGRMSCKRRASWIVDADAEHLAFQIYVRSSRTAC